MHRQRTIESRGRRLALIAGMAVVALLALPVTPASAGRLIATGHDVDDHCDVGDDQCHFMLVATNYVRGGAPDSSRPVLAIECSTDVSGALDLAFGPGTVPRQSVCPSADPGAFNAIALTTDNFSAMIVGSSCDDSINLTPTCDDPGGSTPDSDLINARSADIATFFNAGGGIFAMAGSDNGDGDPSTGPDTYYNFIPLGVAGDEVNPPFCLTAEGIAIGFEDQSCPNPAFHNGTNNDINCCPTHNSFSEPPAESALKVTERDSVNAPETLAAEGVISGGGFQPPPSEPGQVEGCPHPINGTTFQGDDTNETILGTNDNDLLLGGAGNDDITGLPGDDCINGQFGDDLMAGEDGNDLILGEDGTDQASGGNGNDEMEMGADADSATGGPGNDRIEGNRGPDAISGNEDNDRLKGFGDDDTVSGNEGNDRVQGSGGDDKVKGNEGKDNARGGTGDDKVNGDAGNDKVRSQGGEDRINGGTGKDDIRAGGGDDKVKAADGFEDKVKCGKGDDKATVDDKDIVAPDCEKVIVKKST